jgi:hypothetical protein
VGRRSTRAAPDGEAVRGAVGLCRRQHDRLHLICMSLGGPSSMRCEPDQMRILSKALGVAASVYVGLLGHEGSLHAQSSHSPSDTLRGRVIDSVSGVPLANALVLLLSDSGRDLPWDSSRVRALADTSGRFTVPDLPWGHYRMRVLWIGYGPRVVAVKHPIPVGGDLTIGLRSLGYCFDQTVRPIRHMWRMREGGERNGPVIKRMRALSKRFDRGG